MTRALCIALLSALVGAFLFHWVTRFLLRLKLKKRFDRASLGEKEAEDLLEEWGYKIEETQTSSRLSMWINGEEFSYLVRPDAFAVKEDKRYLVEVKTGKQATNPKNTSTRRQLLEYFHGFDVEGVLLIDADLKKIHQIHFEPRKVQVADRPLSVVNEKVSSKSKLLWAFLLGLIIASVLGFLCR